MSSPPPGPLLPVRTAVVLLIAAVVGIVAGMLAMLAYHDVPVAGRPAGPGTAIARGWPTRPGLRTKLAARLDIGAAIRVIADALRPSLTFPEEV